MDPMDSLGLHLKASGEVFACSMDTVWHQGSVHMHPDGRPSFTDLATLLQTLGQPPANRFCITWDLPDYPSLSALISATGCRWVHPTRAMAIARMARLSDMCYEQHVPVPGVHYLALYEEAGRITLAALDFEDKLLVTLETYTVVRESFERTEDAVERLMRIPDLWKEEQAWELECVFEEPGLLPAVRKACQRIQDSPEAHATFVDIRPLDMSTVVQGASINCSSQG